jgi:DNA-binding NarL/FixJ family response regulator
MHHESSKSPQLLSRTAHLSPRQREVLGLLTHGLTNAGIANELGVSLDGAKWHVGELLGALGVDSRHEAARWYLDYARQVSA